MTYLNDLLRDFRRVTEERRELLGAIEPSVQELLRSNRFGISPDVLAGIEAGKLRALGDSPAMARHRAEAKRLESYLGLRFAQTSDSLLQVIESCRLSDLSIPTLSVGLDRADHLRIAEVLREAASSLRVSMPAEIIGMARTTLLAEAAFERASLAKIVTRAPMLEVVRYRTAITSHLAAYADWVAEIPTIAPTGGADTRLLYDLPAVEVFNEGELLYALAPDRHDRETEAARRERRAEIATEQEDELSSLLRELDPALLRAWRGAKQAMRGQSDDAARHVFSSLRTLAEAVLDRLAPEGEVKRWASAGDLTSEGRPTREDRIRYVGRAIAYERLAKAFVADARAVTSAYGILNALHAPDLDVASLELEVIVVRTEGWLRTLLLTARAASPGS